MPAMPESPIASNYTRNEQWAPLAVYGKRAPLHPHPGFGDGLNVNIEWCKSSATYQHGSSYLA